MNRILEQRLIHTDFHPIISVRDQRMIGVEALSRGIDPDSGRLIPPNILFEAARRSDQLLLLDRLCRRKSLENFSRTFENDPDLMLWLNFEPAVFDSLKHQNGNLMDQVLSLGIDPRRIVIEILESRVSDTQALIEFIEIYRDPGFLFAIDDWGTAYSNMERLDQIKPDVIKIHRSLVTDLEKALYKQELIRSTMNLAHGIGAMVVVEGVENESIALCAMDLGACVQQGFYFCRPQACRDTLMTQCECQLDTLSTAYRSRRIKMVDDRRAWFRKIEAIVQEVVKAFDDDSLPEYDIILEGLIKRYSELECLYVLNENGLQITRTVCSERSLGCNPFLFQPPGKGTDRSLSDFSLLIQSGLIRYVSEPYISRSTGNHCVTISRVFQAPNGRRFVICADCDCHQPSLAVAHSRQKILRPV
jgi:EAL domain-containing protein (putative c-di-GMP-specific phosphodiesterase class I)